MAAPQVISLGIGSPADIPNFLTFGLFGDVIPPVESDLDVCAGEVVSLNLRRRTKSLMAERTVESLNPRRRTQVICP